jgi:hypothetical protein
MFPCNINQRVLKLAEVNRKDLPELELEMKAMLQPLLAMLKIIRRLLKLAGLNRKDPPELEPEKKIRQRLLRMLLNNINQRIRNRLSVMR